uniref:S-acyltransferase n=1 Tax=Aegilops tauschii TaxID=37682 RepID=M8CSU8_AEGTA
MALVSYYTVFVLLDHWLGLGTTAGAAHAAAFSLLLAACFFSFLCAAAADPGSVPSAFSPDAEDPQGQGLKSRYCDKCCIHKPARTHHCKVCKRCILKMDHHCVWINNCVGYTNYKAFIICVLNATIGSLYSSVIFVCDLLRTEHDFSIHYVKIIHLLRERSGGMRTGALHTLTAGSPPPAGRHPSRSGGWEGLRRTGILAGVVLFSLSLTIGSLLCWHIYLICHNMTTIEIMGPNVFCWLCPTATGHLKDGTEFQNTNN